MLGVRFRLPNRRTVKRLLAVAAALAIAYLVVMFPLGCGRTLANKLMLFPSTDRLPTYGATERFVETGDGRVQVFVARSPSAMATPRADRYVLCLVGNGGRAERYATDVAMRWGDEPAEVWATNWPGFGRSDGPAALDRLAPAASAAYDAMAEAAGDDAPLFVDADSMGTAAALHLAATKRGSRPVAGLVLKNPPPLRSLLLRRFGWFNLWLAAGPMAAALPRELDSVANARRSYCPAIFIAAEADSMVPPDYQSEIFDAYAGPTRRVVLPGAEHNDPIEPDEAAEIRGRIAEMMNSE